MTINAGELSEMLAALGLLLFNQRERKNPVEKLAKALNQRDAGKFVADVKAELKNDRPGKPANPKPDIPANEGAGDRDVPVVGRRVGKGIRRRGSRTSA